MREKMKSKLVFASSGRGVYVTFSLLLDTRTNEFVVEMRDGLYMLEKLRFSIEQARDATTRNLLAKIFGATAAESAATWGERDEFVDRVLGGRAA